MRWTLRIDGGPKRVNHAAIAIGDRIYSFGGYCSGDVLCKNAPIDVHVLDTGQCLAKKLLLFGNFYSTINHFLNWKMGGGIFYFNH